MWQTLGHWFTPHPYNNHKAKVLHINALFMYAAFFVAFHFLLTTVHKRMPDVLGYATDIYADQLLNFTNLKRQESGLGSLTLNTQLSQAAAMKAQDMFANGYWAHTSPKGRTPWDFITQAGYAYTVAGENLAKNFTNSSGVVDAWMASPTHRDNLLKSSYKEVGFAVVNGVLNGEETTLVVQMFGSTGQLAAKKTATVVPTAAAVTTIIPTPQSTRAILQPTVTPTPYMIAATKQVQIGSTIPFVASAFSSVSIRPYIDIPSFTRIVALTFVAVLLAAFFVDIIYMTKKRVVRISGHTVAHCMFFTVLYVLMSLLSRGSIV